MKLEISKKEDILKKIDGFDGYKNLFMKDESLKSLNETGTFKDRQPQALAKILPESYFGRKVTIAAMSTGNTAFSVAHFSSEYNKRFGKNLAKAVVFIPDTLENRDYFGPDTNMTTVPTSNYIKTIEKMATLVRLNFAEKNKFGRPKYLESLTLAKECLKRDLVDDLFIDVTEGLETTTFLEKGEIKSFSDEDYVKKTKLGIRAYEPVISEAVEEMKVKYDKTPDVIVTQFGAGILFNEVVQYCKDKKIRAKIVPVAVGSPSSVADKIFASFWVDAAEKMQFMGTAHSKHIKYPATVYGIEDWELGRVLNIFEGIIDSEISGLAGLAILHRLENILGEDVRDKNVLVINTGNGIPNFIAPNNKKVHKTQERKLVSIQEASKMLGVHPNSLRLWEKKGIVHSVRIGLRKDRRYTIEEIERLLSSQHSSERGFAFHKGIKEFKKVFDHLASSLNKGDYYWAFAFDSEYANAEVRSVLKKLHESLADKNIEDKVICRESTIKTIQSTFHGNENIKIHGVEFEVPTGVVLLKDRVLYLIWGEDPAIYEILNAEVVRQYKNLFNSFWSK